MSSMIATASGGLARYASHTVLMLTKYTVIEYPHSRPRTLYRDAAVDVAPVNVAADLDVGYIEGAGDVGALALQLGLAVAPLAADALAAGNLSRFDAIILGNR